MPAPVGHTRPRSGFWPAAIAVCCAATFLSNLTISYQADSAGPGARVRDTGFIRALREAFAVGVNPFRYLPDSFSSYRLLVDAADWLRFAAASSSLNLLFSLALLALLAPAAAALRPRLGPNRVLMLIGLFFLLPGAYWPLSFEWYRFLDRTGWEDSVPFAGKLGMLAIMGVLLVAAYALLLRAVAARPRLAANAVRGLASAAVVTTLCGLIWGDRPRPSRLAAPPGSPNVLLISIDTLRADRLSCYGYDRPTSPTIDRIAAQGVLFERLIAASSWTLPTHMSLLTALDPLAHKVLNDGRILALDVPTAAERFLQAGYSTAGVVSSPYLNAFHGFSRGFESYDDYSVGDTLFGAGSYVKTSPSTLARGTAWLDRWDGAGRERPFFLFVHFWDVHHAYNPPPPYDAMFAPAGAAPETIPPGPHTHDLGDEAAAHEREIALYDGEIRYVDTHIAQLLERLERLGALDDTVVAVTADHGEELWQRGYYGHRRTLFDEVTHVPLIIRFPGHLPAGRRVDGVVRQIDIAPTLLELAGLDPVSLGRGDPTLPYAARSLVPLAANDASPSSPSLVAFSDLHDGVVRAVRAGDKKYIEDRESKLYFDLSQDPEELENRILSEPDAALGFEQLLSAWAAAGGPDAGSTEADIPPEQLELLKSLGYIQ